MRDGELTYDRELVQDGGKLVCDKQELVCDGVKRAYNRVDSCAME